MSSSCILVSVITDGFTPPFVSRLMRPGFLSFFALLFLVPVAHAQPTPPVEFAGGRAVSAPELRASFPTAQIAWNGSRFLAVWTSNDDVHAARLSASGELIDSRAFPVAPTWANDGVVEAVGAGDEWGVFISSTLLGGVGAIVDADGTVRASTVFDSHKPLAAAWNGTTFAVALLAPGDAIQLRFLDRDLREVGRVAVAPKLDYQDRVGLVAAGNRFVMLWQERKAPGAIDLVTQVFDDRGTALSTKSTVGASKPFGTADGIPGSWNGTSILVVWPGDSEFQAALIGPDGDVADRFTIPGLPSGGMVSIGWDGAAHLLVWHDRFTRRYEAATLTATGRVIASFGVTLAADAAVPSVAAGSDRYLVTAAGALYSVRPGEIARVELLPPFAWMFAAQSTPRITASESDLAVAWNEAGQIFVSLVAPDGQQIGGPFGGFGLGQLGPVASGRDHHLVTLIRAGKPPLGFIIGREGAGVVTLSADGAPIAAASDGTGYLILNRKSSGYPTSDELIVTTIGNGSLTTSSLLTAEYGLEVFALRWTGSAWALVWRKYLTPLCSGSANCFRSYEDRITLLQRDGTIASESVIRSAVHAHGSERIAGATVTGGRVFVASLKLSPRVLSIETFDLDGTRRTTSSAAVEWGSFGTTLNLVPKPSGATLFATEWNGKETAVVTIDHEGRIQSSLKLRDEIAFSSATHAFGRTWIAYTAGWRYLPQAHENLMSRAYYCALTTRVRAIR